MRGMLTCDTHGELVAPHGEPAEVAQCGALGQRQRQRLPAVPPQRAGAAALVAQPSRARARAPHGRLRCAHVEERRCNKNIRIMRCSGLLLTEMGIGVINSTDLLHLIPKRTNSHFVHAPYGSTTPKELLAPLALCIIIYSECCRCCHVSVMSRECSPRPKWMALDVLYRKQLPGCAEFMAATVTASWEHCIQVTGMLLCEYQHWTVRILIL